MKFGGTSVATPDGRGSIARRVADSLNAGSAPVIVVSAMGRKGAPYATDTLLELIDGLPVDAHERDLLMSCGEVVSAVIVAHELRSAGTDAHAFTGPEAGICTDGVDGSSSVTEVHPAPLVAALEHGVVPVVAGFQGIAEDGRLTTLGRGGSDTTACALGVALEAEAVEIYTDVDGIMTADPRAAADAHVLETIRADELFQMAQHGSRVVHTPAAELALASGVTLRVKNTYSDHPGTTVVDIGAYKPKEVATSVTHTDDVARLKVTLPAAEGTPEHMAAQARVYRAMADGSISLDMFTSAGETLLFSVTADALDGACSVLDDLEMPHAAEGHLAKVTLVGAGMHGVPGVMASMAEYLRDADVTVLQTADSHTTISVLVDEAEMAAAVRALHDGYGLAG
jgi:aspartate kinase